MSDWRDNPASAKYQAAKYASVFKDRQYVKFSPGLRSIGRLLEYCDLYNAKEVTILGSGGGKAAMVLHRLGLQVQLFDLVSNALIYDEVRPMLTLGTIWDMPYEDRSCEMVWCADVLEHIPPSRVGASLKEIARVTQRWALLQISCRDSGVEEEVTGGEPLHMTVREPIWWKAKVEQAGLRIVQWDYSDRSGALFLYTEPSR